MALLGTMNLSLADIAKRKDRDGRAADVIEIAAEVNPILADMTAVPCNNGNSHKSTTRTGYAAGTWRTLYSGVQSTKTTTQQVSDACGMLEALPEIDVDVIDKSEDPAGQRMIEQIGHIEGLSQDIADTVFYGDAVANPERFHGISPRYSAYTRATADIDKIDYNVIHGGGAGTDNTSIYYITWGAKTATMIYPSGSAAGLQHKDLTPNGKGELVDATDSSGKFLAYIDHYKWDIGMALPDWKASGRICNIDVSALEAESSAADLIKKMIILQERLRRTNLGNGYWYMHPRVATQLRIQMLGAGETSAKWNTNLTFENVEGHEVMSFGGKPVHKCDAILLTEALVAQAT